MLTTEQTTDLILSGAPVNEVLSYSATGTLSEGALLNFFQKSLDKLIDKMLKTDSGIAIGKKVYDFAKRFGLADETNEKPYDANSKKWDTDYWKKTFSSWEKEGLGEKEVDARKKEFWIVVDLINDIHPDSDMMQPAEDNNTELMIAQ